MKLLITEEQYKYLSNNSISNDINGKLPLIKTFVNFCKDDLCIKRKIKVILTDDKSKTKTFAHFSPAESSLTVYVKNRHIGDILRSIAHELKHFQQKLNGELTPSSGEDGSPEENEANSFAGVMMRKFGKIRPEIFENYNPSKKKIV
jgi:hypothetical protein